MRTRHPSSKSLSSLPFYGFPVALLVEWLGVSTKTAKRYKAGQSVPLPALRLFTLLKDRRVLPEGWLYNEKTGELCFPEYQLSVPLDQIKADYVVREISTRPVREPDSIVGRRTGY